MVIAVTFAMAIGFYIKRMFGPVLNRFKIFMISVLKLSYDSLYNNIPVFVTMQCYTGKLGLHKHSTEMRELSQEICVN